jgi:Outer membrane protein beta-barrel domain
MISSLLLRKNSIFKIHLLILVGLASVGLNARAQRDLLNLPNHDEKFYHLGIALIYNNSHFQVSAHPQFLQSDSLLSVNPLNTGGFGLAGLHTFRLSKHFEARIVFPQLMFSYKNLVYNLKYPINDQRSVATKQVESILLGFPVQVKFLSDRIDNFRVYMLAGINYQYDLASNATARKADDMVKLKPYDLSIEAGIGFQFFFPVFILSPELKISNGIINEHSRDPNLIYSGSIDQLHSRMIVFSLIFEG